MIARQPLRQDFQYLTISSSAEADLKIKRSRFIALSYPVTSTTECQTRIAEIKRRFHDARHVCYAYRLGHGPSAIGRHSDAGEPSGTAGAAIARVMEGENVCNAMIVVVRYFGGIKLGTGGLARAYSDSARAVLEESGIKQVELVQKVRLRTNYSHLDAINHELALNNANILARDFKDAIDVTFEVPVSNQQKLLDRLNEITSGEIELIISQA